MPTPDEQNIHPEGTAPSETLPSVQELESDDAAPAPPDPHTESTPATESNKKHSRKRSRKQLLYSTIRSQMEFYFSDANISKQGMMRKLIESAEYVSLSVFLEKFNKITNLTKNIEDLQRALKYSNKLVLSEDKTGVKRAVPFDETKLKTPEEIEECTIYVENIPMSISSGANANGSAGGSTSSSSPHDWIHKIFQEFGTVSYVSLPKFKKTGQHKGFAFVEFEDRAGAQGCLKAFGELGACLPTDIDPSGLLSITTFNEEHQEQPKNLKSILTKRKKGQTVEEDSKSTSATPNKKIKFEDSDEEVAPSKKIKVEPSEDEPAPLKKIKVEPSEDEPAPLKKIKVEASEEEPAPLKKIKVEPSEDEPGSSKKHELDESAASSPKKKIKIEKSETPEKVVKPEKRIRFQEPEPDPEPQASKKPKIENESASEASGSGTDTLAVEDGEKKKKKKKRRKNKNQEFHVEKLESDLIHLRILPKRNWRQLRNRYLNLQRENMGKLKAHLRTQENKKYLEQAKPKSSIPQILTSAGKYKSICVKIGLESPANSVEEFKNQITTEIAPEDWSNFVKHVDYKEGDLEGIVRLDGGPMAGEGVQIFVANATKVFKTVHLMSEQETDEYWKSLRIELKKQKKQKKVRGKDKLLNQATKFATSHIHFDDSEVHVKEEGKIDDE